jgi:hypothetical protein
MDEHLAGGIACNFDSRCLQCSALPSRSGVAASGIAPTTIWVNALGPPGGQHQPSASPITRLPALQGQKKRAMQRQTHRTFGKGPIVSIAGGHCRSSSQEAGRRRKPVGMGERGSLVVRDAEDLAASTLMLRPRRRTKPPRRRLVAPGGYIGGSLAAPSGPDRDLPPFQYVTGTCRHFNTLRVTGPTGPEPGRRTGPQAISKAYG